jgi:hypothetical protein
MIGAIPVDAPLFTGQIAALSKSGPAGSRGVARGPIPRELALDGKIRALYAGCDFPWDAGEGIRGCSMSEYVRQHVIATPIP